MPNRVTYSVLDLCSIQGCGNPAKSRGWCYKHYQRWYKHGDPHALERRRRIPEGSLCAIEDCIRPDFARGWCELHYERWRKHGDPRVTLNPRREPRKPGGRSITKDGYIKVYFPDHPNAGRGGMVNEHVMVMCDAIGRPLLPDETVHHINGVKADNRIANLELWSSSHPPGQRVRDKVAWAWEIINRYDSDH